MVKFDDLLERTAGLRWNEPLERLAGARLQRLADPHGSLAGLRQAAGARADVAAEVAAAFTVGETWFHRFGEQLDAAAPGGVPGEFSAGIERHGHLRTRRCAGRVQVSTVVVRRRAASCPR